ncbi:MAG: hypothetical protein ACKOQM_12615 [Novosphingobium sp.]
MSTAATDEFTVMLSMMATPDDPKAKHRKLSFTLQDKTPNPAMDAQGKKKVVVGNKEDKTATLTIAPGEERYINVRLSDMWSWTFADEPLSVQLGDARNYVVVSKSKSEIRIWCKPTHADPMVGQDDKLDFSVLLDQHEGRSVLVTIDPVTENPPPTHGDIGDADTSGMPLPIA